MIVLDASVLISYWGEADVHAGAAFEVLDTDEELALHPVTLAETLVWPARHGTEQDALEDLVRLGVERYEPLFDEPVRVARIRVELALKLSDAYVLATAVATESTLATFDRRLATVARERGVTVVGV